MKTVAAIIGGAGGIGRATAIALSKQVDVIVIGDLLQENIDYTSKILTSLNIEHVCKVMDVREREQVDDFAAFAAAQGDLVVSVNIAGVGPSTTYKGTPYSTCRETYDTNSWGAFNSIEAFLAHAKEGYVHIETASQASYYADMDDAKLEIFKSVTSSTREEFLDAMCSITDIFIDDPEEDEPEVNGQAYCFSKRFVRELANASTWRFARKGARILTISPGTHWTCHVWDLDEDSREGNHALTPLGAYGRTVDLGQIYAFAASPVAKYISGADILVDGGGTTSFGSWKL
ncbi:MAG: SDR family oxidoreductase [Atopobiaceae bacterium]|nr:SDR family oxidoreductase [Atopobiaceae bacterium]